MVAWSEVAAHFIHFQDFKHSVLQQSFQVLPFSRFSTSFTALLPNENAALPFIVLFFLCIILSPCLGQTLAAQTARKVPFITEKKKELFASAYSEQEPTTKNAAAERKVVVPSAPEKWRELKMNVPNNNLENERVS